MKNKVVMMIVMVAATITSALGNTGNEPKVVSVDVDRSEIVWVGKKVTGEHSGNIELKSGGFEFSNGVLSGGNFVMDMHSITNSDLEDEGMNSKLVGHLKSDDFFGVEKYPEAKLEIQNVEKHANDQYHLTGEITIKGITKSITFPASVNDYGDSYSASADVVIDRSEFNVRYGSGSFFDNLGDKMIYDDFELKITLVANK
jgi:polyisoprenoid-binding protein YceI